MKALGALGGVVACAGAGVAVAASPKPAGAPLNPPVEQARAAATPVATCAAGGVDPAVAAAVQQLRAASTPAERRAVLRGLSADQRQQVTALLRGRAGAQPAAGSCDGGAPAQPMPAIVPDVVEGGPTAAPVTDSYVS